MAPAGLRAPPTPRAPEPVRRRRPRLRRGPRTAWRGAGRDTAAAAACLPARRRLGARARPRSASTAGRSRAPAAVRAHRRRSSSSPCGAGRGGGAFVGPAPRSAGRPHAGAGHRRAPPPLLTGREGRRAASGCLPPGAAAVAGPLRSCPLAPSRALRPQVPAASAPLSPPQSRASRLCGQSWSASAPWRLRRFPSAWHVVGVLSWRSSEAGLSGAGPAQHPRSRPPAGRGHLRSTKSKTEAL